LVPIFIEHSFKGLKTQGMGEENNEMFVAQWGN
jgi:hypothetical protein